MHKLAILPAVLAIMALANVATAQEPIVPADAKLELLYTRTAAIHGGLTEGPAAAPDGSIYFTDIPAGADKSLIVRFDPKTGMSSVFAADGFKANGLAFDPQGHLVACEGPDQGGRGLARWDVATGQRTVIVDNYMGKRFNGPNDLVIDKQGRIYFTDPRYMGDEPRELEHRAVYRVGADNVAVEVTHEIEKPNGIALSPDQKTLYVADHNNGTDKIDPAAAPPKKGAMTINAYPLGDDGLVNGPKRVIHDFGMENGCDGMTIDSHGNLYLTARGLKRPGVLIIDPTGKEIGFLPTGPSQPDAKEPTGLPSNVEFGRGEESNMLYITIDMSLYRVRLNSHRGE